MARATRLTTSTNRVRMKAPAQASECQLSYGLIAYWKITTGTLAIGAMTSVVQYWLLSAVNSSGAVSPEIREIGRAHVWTPVTNAPLLCRLLLEKKKLITNPSTQELDQT